MKFSARVAASLGAVLALSVFLWVALRTGYEATTGTIAPTETTSPADGARAQMQTSAVVSANRSEAADITSRTESGVLPTPPSGVLPTEVAAVQKLTVLDEMTDREVPGAWARLYWTRDESLASAWNQVTLTADDGGSTFALPAPERGRVDVAGLLVGSDAHAPQWVLPYDRRSWDGMPREVHLQQGGGVALSVLADQPLPAFLFVEQVGVQQRYDWVTHWPVLANGELVVPVVGTDPVSMKFVAVDQGLQGELYVPVPPTGLKPFGSLHLETKRLLDTRVLRSSGGPAPSLGLLFSATDARSAGHQLQTDDAGFVRCFEEDLRERDIFAELNAQRIPPTSVQLDPSGAGATVVFPLSMMTLEVDSLVGDPVEAVQLQPLDASMKPTLSVSSIQGAFREKVALLVPERIGLYVVGRTESGRRLAALVRPETIVGDVTVRLQENPDTLGSLRVDCTGLELGPEESLPLRVTHNRIMVATTLLEAGQVEWSCGALFPGEYSVEVVTERGYSFAVPSTAVVTVAPGTITDVPFEWQRGGRLRLEVREESADATSPTEWSARLRDSAGQWRELRFLHQTQFGRTKSATIPSGAPATVEGIFPAGPALLELATGTERTEHPVEIEPGRTVTTELQL